MAVSDSGSSWIFLDSMCRAWEVGQSTRPVLRLLLLVRYAYPVIFGESLSDS